jgi:hypothetical protein
MNKSFVKKPTNILPIHKRNRGNPIAKGASWAFCIAFLNPFGLLRNVKYISLND